MKKLLSALSFLLFCSPVSADESVLSKVSSWFGSKPSSFEIFKISTEEPFDGFSKRLASQNINPTCSNSTKTAEAYFDADSSDALRSGPGIASKECKFFPDGFISNPVSATFIDDKLDSIRRDYAGINQPVADIVQELVKRTGQEPKEYAYCDPKRPRFDKTTETHCSGAIMYGFVALTLLERVAVWDFAGDAYLEVKSALPKDVGQLFVDFVHFQASDKAYADRLKKIGTAHLQNSARQPAADKTSF